MLKDEKIIETKVCKHCQANFEITDKDLEFYEKVSPVFKTPSNFPLSGGEQTPPSLPLSREEQIFPPDKGELEGVLKTGLTFS